MSNSLPNDSAECLPWVLERLLALLFREELREDLDRVIDKADAYLEPLENEEHLREYHRACDTIRSAIRTRKKKP